MKRALGGYLLLTAAAGALAMLFGTRPGGGDPWDLPVRAAEPRVPQVDAAVLTCEVPLPADTPYPRTDERPALPIEPPLAAEPALPSVPWDVPPAAPPMAELPGTAPSVAAPSLPASLAQESSAPPPLTSLVQEPPAPPPPPPVAPVPENTADSPSDAEGTAPAEAWDGVLPMTGTLTGPCDLCGACCCNLVKHVIWTPMDITEIRMESHTVTETKEQEQTYTVFRRVPVTREIKKTECYLVDEVRTKVITEKECYRVDNPVVTTYTAKVPVTEVREEMCKKTICTEEGPVCVEVPVTRVVTVEQEQECTEVSQRPGVVFGTTTCEISYIVKVPKTREVVCSKQTEYKLVPVEQKRTVQVCVPKIIELPNEVTVCKMVPQVVYCCEGCANKHGGLRACLSEHCSQRDKEGPFAKLHEAWTDHLDKHQGPFAKLQAHRQAGE